MKRRLNGGVKDTAQIMLSNLWMVRGGASLTAIPIPTLSRELAPLRVNNVSAGPTDTPYWDDMDPDARQAMFDKQARALSVGRIAQPADIGEAIVFLATNGFTTGSILDCDGGAGFIPWS